MCNTSIMTLVKHQRSHNLNSFFSNVQSLFSDTFHLWNICEWANIIPQRVHVSEFFKPFNRSEKPSSLFNSQPAGLFEMLNWRNWIYMLLKHWIYDIFKLYLKAQQIQHSRRCFRLFCSIRSSFVITFYYCYVITIYFLSQEKRFYFFIHITLTSEHSCCWWPNQMTAGTPSSPHNILVIIAHLLH